MRTCKCGGALEGFYCCRTLRFEGALKVFSGVKPSGVGGCKRFYSSGIDYWVWRGTGRILLFHNEPCLCSFFVICGKLCHLSWSKPLDSKFIRQHFNFLIPRNREKVTRSNFSADEPCVSVRNNFSADEPCLQSVLHYWFLRTCFQWSLMILKCDILTKQRVQNIRSIFYFFIFF